MERKVKFQRIIRLFEKDFWTSLDEKEQTEFDGLLENELWNHLHEEMQDGTLWKEGYKEKEIFPADKAFREFERRVYKRRIYYIKKYLSISIAAAVVVLAISSIYWLLSRKENFSDIPVVQNQFAHQKAFLQFQNGDSVLLSEIPTVLNQIDGSQVNYDGKKVVYTAEGKLGQKIDTNRLVVPRGGECFVILEDGTKVWINAASSIRYPSRFGEGERKVFVEGEVFLDVAKDTSRRFIVETSYGNIAVYGTEFGVRQYGGECMQTTLVSGKVEYRGNCKVVLNPGEQIVVYPSGEVEKRKVNVEDFVSWKDGVYIFEQRSLEEIMADFSRWYDVEIVFLSEKVRKLCFTGDVERYDHISSFLKLLEKTEDVHYRIVGKRIELY